MELSSRKFSLAQQSIGNVKSVYGEVRQKAVTNVIMPLILKKK